MKREDLPDHPFVRNSFPGLSRWYLVEVLTWPDDEVLDELCNRNPGGWKPTLHQKRELERALAEFRAWQRTEDPASYEAEARRMAGLARGRAAQSAESARKRALVGEHAAVGLSQTQVAVKTGIPLGTVKHYWPRRK